MDRNIVYPGSIPLDTDLLYVNKSTMLGLGFLAQAVLGTNTVIDGLLFQATVPASMTVNIGPGSMTQFGPVDTSAYGSLAADLSESVLKMGINTSPTPFTFTAPVSAGQSQVFLIEAAFQETDSNPVVLPYYNASNPAQTFSGPANSGAAQNTTRIQRVQLQVKAGASANTGSQAAPLADSGWFGLYLVTVAYGQTQITAANIGVLPTAPMLTWKLPTLRPGFGSGILTYTSSGTFVVPLGVIQAEVEVWGGGSGSYASVPGLPSGGGAGGGYAKKLVTGLFPGQAIAVTVGTGGAGGTTAGGAAGPGTMSSFGNYASATGGSVNYVSSVSNPQSGSTPPGIGIGGDVNLVGSTGQAGILNQGGMGGGGPMGGSQNSGTNGNGGIFPGGGASGAGTGPAGNASYNGAAGAGGFVVVRW